MLPGKYRLKKKTEIRRVLKFGKSFRGEFLILKIAPSGLDCSRWVCIVSLKVSKRAVIRNKIKRRVAETIKPGLERFKKGFDAIFIAQSGLENKNFQEMREIINKLLEQAKLYV